MIGGLRAKNWLRHSMKITYTGLGCSMISSSSSGSGASTGSGLLGGGGLDTAAGTAILEA